MIVVISIVILALIGYGFVWKSVSGLESYSYEVIEEFEGFEIRRYSAANFSYVEMPSQSYESTSSAGFRTLANFIFGGNEEQQQIAMTTPVAMNMDKNVTMMFMLPSEYELDEVPAPNSDRVQFKRVEEKVVAAIRFRGWANDEKIQVHAQQLKTMLDKQGIAYADEVTFFGYDPPYQLVNRRNEVVLEVEYPPAQ